MRRNVFVRSFLLGLFVYFLSLSASLHAQGHVKDWPEFVHSAENILVSDTFLLQSFDGGADNTWEYELIGNAELFDFMAEAITDLYGKKALKLYAGGRVVFRPIDTRGYDNIYVKFFTGGRSCNPKQLLQCKPMRDNEEIITLEAPTKAKTNMETRLFQSTPKNGKLPQGFELWHGAEGAKTKTGFYYLDHVFAYTLIPRYSLATKPGSWDDALCWSHKVPERSRSALIATDVKIGKDVICDEVRIGRGSLTVTAGKKMHMNHLLLYDNLNEKGSYYSYGDTYISDAVSVVKTFPSKGLWYFVSFPFDVYRDDVDAAFSLRDEKEKGVGNFFYVKTYNHTQRARTGVSPANWEVVKTSDIPANGLLFQKNVGYLIALDSGAKSQTISFRSRVGVVEDDFGRVGTMDVLPAFGSLDQDNGWCLCGNPLPGYLSLRSIEANEQLYPAIWVYNGMEYVCYPLDSDFVLPPFSAFFVKAKGGTTIKVHTSPFSVKREHLIPIDLSISREPTEPTHFQTFQEEAPCRLSITYKDDCLYVQGLKCDTEVSVYNQLGVLVSHKVVHTGQSSLPLHLQQGVYIVSLCSSTQRQIGKIAVQQ